MLQLIFSHGSTGDNDPIDVVEISSEPLKIGLYENGGESRIGSVNSFMLVAVKGIFVV